LIIFTISIVFSRLNSFYINPDLAVTQTKWYAFVNLFVHIIAAILLMIIYRDLLDTAFKV
jgi:hypothetical protein